MKHAKGISFGKLHFVKKKKKMALSKNLHFKTKKNRTASLFVLEKKQRQFWNP